MSGSVYEWTWDWYGPLYSTSDGTDPTGREEPQPNHHRVIRGGSHSSSIKVIRSAARLGQGGSATLSNGGFRVDVASGGVD